MPCSIHAKTTQMNPLQLSPCCGAGSAETARDILPKTAR
jgi:hypothetical protein